MSSLYYTPTADGLASFHCNVTFDWKGFLEGASGKTVAEDAAGLVYLRSVQLSIDDDLKTGGHLNWNAATQPSQELASSMEQIRSGMMQTWSGFFQTWNGFMNGYMVAVTDDKTKVERNAEGFHLIAKEGDNLAEEQYDKNHLLEYMHVKTANMEVTVNPTYVDGPQGRIVKVLQSAYKQPATAPATNMTMKMQYATVAGFQLPSELQVDIENVAHFRFQMSGCTVKTLQNPVLKAQP